MNSKAFIFIGRSGSGKGTQAKLLTDFLKKKDPSRQELYLQSGKEFRTFIQGESHTQRLAKAIYDVGGLQPEFLAVHMWTNILTHKFTGHQHLIFDGMPRKLHEAGVLDSIFDFYKLDKPFVVNVKVSKDWSVSRLMARGRLDDKEDLIRERLSWFETEVEGAIKYYRSSPKYHFIELNGEQSIEKVHEELIEKINKIGL